MTSEAHKALFEKILSYAVYLLSAREYSRKLLQEKIEKKYYEKTREKSEEKREDITHICEEVLQFLTEKKYIDDRRTAENFLRYRREYSPRGRRMIAQDMYIKKIDPEISEEILAEFSEEEEQSDCNLLAKKKWEILKIREDHEAQKAKLFRFLAGKGFPYSMINSSWEEIPRNSL